MSALEITPATAGHELDDTKKAKVEDIQDVEIGDVRKPDLYSKVSVYLTMVFSGLALGSDGYNAAVVGNL
ncbi:GIT1 [Fusarium subglutinans]|uniref:GIT1 n=1 Tax=Gibberella subglutinans TaxID=42677 RepID=A0A8H5P560_GIBSU|nr:GIT1 [Fusarium subglutinans]KAF5590812.1 GIT1 [Fusarium subglutinans]